ncbi:MAG: PEP-CTERM sorting domain-containing protein [Aphanothece sp. CMT-3BRIN-NPC111]|jgi:hypothetical protein|nr:PEP-CTERM sorting domain-containing protein [Aphanothece sp. CMT-3BRIN-NPC111]
MIKLKALRPSVVFSSAVATVAISAVISTATPAGAVSFPPVYVNFGCSSDTNAGNCQTGESQFVAKVSQTSTGQVLFEFYNRAKDGMTALASSITDIYFDDNSPFSLYSVAEIRNSSGVSFSQYARPGNLPGGADIGFSADYSADSNSPVQPNGVNPGESIGILFNVRSGFDDPFNAVITDLQRGNLRLGIHGQGFSNGGSESFVNEAVPEPFTFLGSGVALGIGAFLQRKSSKLKKKLPH